MVNLKKFCRNLRNEMVSHITLYLPSIAKPSLHLFDLILSKTRFSNHISFLSRCLRYKVIPNGFKSSFSLHVHSANHRHTISHRVTRVCYEHSRRLMRIAIDSMSLHLSTIDYHASSADRTNLVVTISPDLTLSDSERSVLAKGLKFVPNPGSLDLFSVKADTESFFRRLRLKAHFHNQPSVPHKDVFEAINPKKSSWSPPDDQYGSLELFIRQCRHDIDILPKFRPKRPSNLTPSEFSALNSLRARNDIVIKPADKGGALVVWKADLYREEANRQLSDTTFYSRVDKDLTSTHQTTISNTIHNFIASGDLPETAKNLITTTPHTPVMYFLPKIHKPNNPGRPIVSACSCPTELISSFLDHVMAPLVKDLPSYIKDTKHALQIFQNIRFNNTHKFIFTMDVKSLYTVIPHHDGLRALKFFLDKRPNQEPSTSVLVRLAELVLTLNNFFFDGEHYQQISGVAMGTKMGPNYANLFVGFVEKTDL